MGHRKPSPEVIFLQQRPSSPLRSGRAPRRQAGSSGSLGPGNRPLSGGKGWTVCPQQGWNGQNPSQLVPWAQTQGLEEAQSKAMILPPSRPAHFRPGCSLSSSGSLGKDERKEGTQDVAGPPACIPTGQARGVGALWQES